MGWYDVFSRFYDPTLERLYRPVRTEAFSRLDGREAGEEVWALDLACGTGQNFPHLFERYGTSLRLVGLDASDGMLDRARKRCERGGWPTAHLVSVDARRLSRAELGRQGVLLPAVGLDLVVCTLGFSALPDWELVFERAFELLAPGGQFLIFDVWAERWVPQKNWVQLVARAVLERKVWEPLERCSVDFELDFLEGSPHVHGGRLLLATGRAREVSSRT